MATYVIEGVTPEILAKGLDELRDSGFTVDGNAVSGMGIQATYKLEGEALTVDVEKAPPFLAGMVEKQLRSFFS
jgi:hypothetical protein